MNLAITGTSGAGKSHLEQELKKTGRFMPIPKVTTRALRESEKGSKDILSVSLEEFNAIEKHNGFIFTLDYKDNRYGWRKSDMKKLEEQGFNPTIGITIESMSILLKNNDNFIPIYLKFDHEGLDLLEDRMRERGETEESIARRLELAKSEFERFGSDYEDMIIKHGGKNFYIKDDDTLYDEVIPWIEGVNN